MIQPVWSSIPEEDVDAEPASVMGPVELYRSSENLVQKLAGAGGTSVCAQAVLRAWGVEGQRVKLLLVSHLEIGSTELVMSRLEIDKKKRGTRFGPCVSALLFLLLMPLGVLVYS